jgi:hypothetical protein
MLLEGPCSNDKGGPAAESENEEVDTDEELGGYVPFNRPSDIAAVLNNDRLKKALWKSMKQHDQTGRLATNFKFYVSKLFNLLFTPFMQETYALWAKK